jgi:adenylate cyclase
LDTPQLKLGAELMQIPVEMPAVDNDAAKPQGLLAKLKPFKAVIVNVAAVGAVVSGLVGYYSAYKTVAAPAATVPAASVAASMNDVNPLSIVVLPFANLTGDPTQTYVADGLTVSVTSDLSRLQGAFIVNAVSAAAFRDKAVDAQQVGQKLGVRFVLQGNVQRNANKLRINAQLADTTNNAQLWSETFEGDQSDLFALQDQVTTRIGNSIGREMLVNAARASEKVTSNPKVADLLLRARATSLAQRSPTYFDDIERQFREVLKLDPNNALALATLAANLGLRAQYFSHTLPPDRRESYFVEGRELALKAKQIDPDNPTAYVALTMYAESHDDYPGALRYAKMSYQLAPREQRYANTVAHELLLGGEAKQALTILNQTLALNPKFPIDQVLFNLGWGSFMAGDYDACIAWFQRTIESNITYIDAYGWMAMAYAMKGDMEKSKEQLLKLQKADPNNSFRTRRRPMSSSPQVYKDFYRDTVMPAAQKAGIVL